MCKKTLTDNERELIELIRTNDDPTQALITAIEVLAEFLAKNNL